MGTYLFERHTEDGAGRESSASLSNDIALALRQIDWVDHFTVYPEDGEEIVRADIVFDEEWPDLRASEPGFVATVFHRLGLRTIPNPALAHTQADDPLGTSHRSDDDPESMDLFLFEE